MHCIQVIKKNIFIFSFGVSIKAKNIKEKLNIIKKKKNNLVLLFIW